MAWDSGNILFSSNFEMRVGKPLDAKQVVPANADLNSITFPYDGLIVHVTGTEKTYVCIAKDDVPTGVDGGGVVDETVWKEVGAGSAAATTVTLEDESSAPTGAADKIILYSDKEESAASLPNHLYLFDEGADGLVAVDWGRDSVLYAGGGTDGLKYNNTTGDYNYYSGSTIYGLFAAGTEPNVRVGGAAADFTLDGLTVGERADFEFQFQIGLDTLGGKTHTLISTDPPGHVVETAGFYWLGLYAASSEDDSYLVFQYYSGTPTALTTARWKIPGTLSTSDYRSTLALSFFEDDRSFSTTNIDPSVGKFRCYWNGSVLEDKDNAGVSHVAGSFTRLGKLNSANYPVYLGQFLDGDSSSGGVGFNPSLMFLEGKMHEFSLHNHRCIHNTSDSYLAPSGPTRSVPLSVAKIADSDNSHSTILTTSNLGMLLPKSIEGLADGSPWNDRGAVRIAPLTGDLDAPEAVDIASGVLSLPAGTAPAATAGVAKIYAKNFVVGGLGDALFHFDDNLNDEQGGDAAVFEAASTVGTPSYTTGASGFGKRIAVYNSAVYIYQSTNDQWIKFTAPGVGASPFTAEFFVTMDNTDAYQALISNAGGLNQSNQTTGFTTIFGHFSLSLRAADAGGDTLELWVQPTNSGSNTRVEVQFDPTSGARVSTGAPVHVALARTISGTDSVWHCWIGGTYMTANGTTGRTTTGVANLDIDDWNLGKGFKGTQSTWSHTVMKAGYFDEFRVTKGDPSYTVGSNLTVPTAPFTAVNPVTVARLFCMDSLGNETQITT